MIAKRTWQTIASVAFACIVGYFLYHTVQGDRGWFAMLRLQGQVNSAQNTLSQLQKEHKDLDHRVSLMRPGNLDPDLLDEKSREMLDYSKPNEIVIITPPEKKENVLQRSK
ncbi:MAG: septum formation initiator family protein [Alphaproteobacteria bacterium]|nr:septum formation initiator family protein [Alphaproteobacteria bacterium]